MKCCMNIVGGYRNMVEVKGKAVPVLN